MDTVEIRFSSEDLAALAVLLGLELPTSLIVDAQVLHGDHFDDAVAVATRGLQARGLVDATGGPDAVVDPVAQLVRLLCGPGLVVALRRRDRLGVREATLFAQPTVVVEHRRAMAGVHRLTVLHPDSVLGWVQSETGLGAGAVGRPGDDAERAGPLSMPARRYRELCDLAILDDTAAALDLLPSAIDSRVARSLVAALAGAEAAVAVATVHRSSEQVIAGGTLSWLEHEGACWIVPDDDGVSGEPHDGEVELRRSSHAEVLDELVGYLPITEPATT